MKFRIAARLTVQEQKAAEAPNDGGPVIWSAAKIGGMTSAGIITQFFRST
jgi:hypothetical protein